MNVRAFRGADPQHARGRAGAWLALIVGRLLVLAFLAGLNASRPALAATDTDSASETQVKAAFLYKFVEYIEWPEDAFSSDVRPFTFAIAGDDALATALQAIVAGRKLGGRDLAVRRLRANEDATDAHVVFVSRRQASLLPRLASADRRPVLYVSDYEGALRDGAIINFVTGGTRLLFEASIEQAEMRQISLGSRLLSVALNTRRSP